MSEPFVYKPSTSKGPVVLLNYDSPQAPTMTLADGTVVTARKAGQGAPGVYRGDNGYQWVFPTSVLGQSGATLSVGGKSQVLDNTNMSWRGSDVGSLTASNKGAVGSGTGGSGGAQQFGYGFAPEDISGKFPAVTNVETAPYKYTNPQDFAKEFGDFNRGEMQQNFGQAEDNALSLLSAELKGLAGYVPTAAALKRSETSADNVFNQQQKTAQIDSVLPEVRGQLNAQGQRAESYVQGQLPNAIDNEAISQNARSRAAGASIAAGFGASSSAAQKASTLMSADRRLEISAMGENLLNSNIKSKAELLLAPTEYSNAGGQINVNPTQSAAQLATQQFSELNQNTLINPTNALNNEVEQQKYQTTNEQQTRIINAAAANNFALHKFDYQASLAGAVAGAAQTNSNTEVALDQQEKDKETFDKNKKDTQKKNDTGAIATGVGAIATGAAAIATSGSGNSSSDSGDSSDDEGSTPNSESTDNGPLGTEGDEGNTDSSDEGTFDDSGDTPVDDGGSYEGDSDSDFESIGDDYTISMDRFSAKNLNRAAAPVLKIAGISSKPGINTVQTGYDTKGKPVYMDKQLVTSTDTNIGKQQIQSFTNTIKPFKVFKNAQDQQGLERIGSISSDPSNIEKLDNLANTKDSKSFVNRALEYFGMDPKTAKKTEQGLTIAAGAAKLYTNWGNMSPAQKSLGLMGLGIRGYKLASGENLASAALVKGSNGKPLLTLGQGLSLLQQGINSYTLADKWNQLSPLGKIAGVGNQAYQLGKLGQGLGVLGTGTGGAAVPGITPELLSKTGWQTAPTLGNGAVVSASGKSIPNGYVKVKTLPDGSTVAAPAGTADIVINGLGTAVSVLSVAQGAKQVWKGQGMGGTQGVANGALGGTAMVSGLMALGATNPYLLAGIMAYSVVSNGVRTRQDAVQLGNPDTYHDASNQMLKGVGKTFGGKRGEKLAGQYVAYTTPWGQADTALKMSKSGKSGDQRGRDDIRSNFQKIGIADGDYNITLADGTKANIGIDGHGEERAVTNPSLLTPEQKGIKKLRAYDVDYTNDLDFISGSSGINLSRLIHGTSNKEVDQIGGQLGNAALKNVGFGKALTPENFNKVMQNQRGIYAQAGITSKAQGYQLANQAHANGTLNDVDYVNTLNTLNVIYDKDGYSTAQKLMQGRNRGIEVAHQEAAQGGPGQPVNPPGISGVTKNIDPSFQANATPGAAPIDQSKITNYNGSPGRRPAKGSPGRRPPKQYVSKSALQQINKQRYQAA